MKKTLLILVVMLLACASIFAGLRFDTYSADPLYKESLTDDYGLTSSFKVDIVSDKNQAPWGIGVILKDQATGISSYQKLNYRDPSSKTLLYFNMKAAMNAGLLRLSLTDSEDRNLVQVEANLGGSLNTVFCGFEKNDALGYDGTYFIGGTIRILDTISIRAGLHHFSGHYGDEMLDKLYLRNKINYAGSPEFATVTVDGKNYYVSGLVEYVRDNSWLLGIRTDLPFGLEIHAQAELPKNPSWFRPLAHVPADYKNPVDGDSGRPTLIDRIGGDAADGEQFSQAQLDEEQTLKRTANGSYKGWRIQVGASFRYNFKKVGFILSGDVQFHQDGQTLHKVGGYDPKNPWEMECTVGGGVILKNTSDAMTCVINAQYHIGRFPLLNYFYQRTNYISVGVSFI